MPRTRSQEPTATPDLHMKPADNPTLLEPEHAGHRQRITAFLPAGVSDGECEDGAGNPCLLIALDSAPEATAPVVPNTTLCQSWPTEHLGHHLAQLCAPAHQYDRHSKLDNPAL